MGMVAKPRNTDITTKLQLYERFSAGRLII
jgi:hypothetical protein